MPRAGPRERGSRPRSRAWPLSAGSRPQRHARGPGTLGRGDRSPEPRGGPRGLAGLPWTTPRLAGVPFACRGAVPNGNAAPSPLVSGLTGSRRQHRLSAAAPAARPAPGAALRPAPGPAPGRAPGAPPCPRLESNQHSFRNRILSPARLPIPPRGLGARGPQGPNAGREDSNDGPRGKRKGAGFGPRAARVGGRGALPPGRPAAPRAARGRPR